MSVQKTIVYNFEVADTHSYLVGDSIWVHNYDRRTGRVEKNDSLWNIAKELNEKYGTKFTPEELASNNGININDNLDLTIYPGGKIVVSEQMVAAMNEEQKANWIKDFPDSKVLTLDGTGIDINVSGNNQGQSIIS